MFCIRIILLNLIFGIKIIYLKKGDKMNNDEIGKIVLKIIEDINPDADISGLDYAASLKEQMELDSMDFLDIVMELRKQYTVEVPEADYANLRTMDSCIEYLGPKLIDKPYKP